MGKSLAFIVSSVGLHLPSALPVVCPFYLGGLLLHLPLYGTPPTLALPNLFVLTSILPCPLCARSADLQKAALDADAVKHLAAFLSRPEALSPPAASSATPPAPSASISASPAAPASQARCAQQSSLLASPLPGSSLPLPSKPVGSGHLSLQEGVLRALSSLCMDQSDGRKQLVEAKVRGGAVDGRMQLVEAKVRGALLQGPSVLTRSRGYCADIYIQLMTLG